MKNIKTPIAALFAACLLLTGCKDVTKSTPDSSHNSPSLNDTNTLKTDVSQLVDPSGSKKPVETEKLTEAEQIFKLMKNYGNLYYSLQPGSYAALEKIADKKSKIMVEGKDYPYLKLTKAPANTMTELSEKLDGLVTEKLKNEFLDSITNNNYHYQIKDGNIYVTEECFAYGMGHGMDCLYLDSIEYSDENTVLVNMTSFGDKNNWETEKDIEDKFTVKLVRTDDGLKIDDCNSMAAAFLYYYNEFTYGDIALGFPKTCK